MFAAACVCPTQADVMLLKQQQLVPIAIPLVMGVLQAVALATWNLVCYVVYGLDDVEAEITATSTVGHVLGWYATA